MQDRGDGAAKQEAPGGMEEMAAMMEAFMKAATPGPQHAQLATWDGRWKLVVKHWMDPNMPPQESDATSTFKMLMDGRYLMENADGSTPMGPFKGMGITAFDNVSQKFVNVWMDNMGTGIMIARAPAGDGSVIKYAGKYNNPLGGAETAFRAEMVYTSPDARKYTMWEDRAGKEVKVMEITYERAQG
jgi:hypothetical protein